MKLRCLLIRHRWRLLRTEDGERYEQCQRCGQFGTSLPPGARNVAGIG